VSESGKLHRKLRSGAEPFLICSEGGLKGRGGEVEAYFAKSGIYIEGEV
jgi:hypothetical protein